MSYIGPQEALWNFFGYKNVMKNWLVHYLIVLPKACHWSVSWQWLLVGEQALVPKTFLTSWEAGELSCCSNKASITAVGRGLLPWKDRLGYELHFCFASGPSLWTLYLPFCISAFSLLSVPSLPFVPFASCNGYYHTAIFRGQDVGPYPTTVNTG